MDSDEPAARYAYMVEGVLTSGTLADYAKAWENTHYSGDRLSSTVMTWSGTHHTVWVRQTRQHDDYMYYVLTANGETAGAVIDGRS